LHHIIKVQAAMPPPECLSALQGEETRPAVVKKPHPFADLLDGIIATACVGYDAVHAMQIAVVRHGNAREEGLSAAQDETFPSGAEVVGSFLQSHINPHAPSRPGYARIRASAIVPQPRLDGFIAELEKRIKWRSGSGECFASPVRYFNLAKGLDIFIYYFMIL
jgi:hypothetical protein